jgi:hypothetical protein
MLVIKEQVFFSFLFGWYTLPIIDYLKAGISINFDTLVFAFVLYIFIKFINPVITNFLEEKIK